MNPVLAIFFLAAIVGTCCFQASDFKQCEDAKEVLRFFDLCRTDDKCVMDARDIRKWYEKKDIVDRLCKNDE